MSAFSKYYKWSAIISVIAVMIGFFIGGIETAFTVAVLGILETSLSFDNAVANARVLKNWDHAWRQRFLVWGMLIAVFGMRLIFPLGIVSVTTGLDPVSVTKMALYDPTAYGAHLTAVHHQVAGFGGAFLFMVAMGFFFEKKNSYWIEIIEQRLTKLGQIEGVSGAITLLGSYVVSRYYGDPAHGIQFFVASVFGVATFILTHGLGSVLGGDDDGESEDQNGSPLTGNIIKASIAGFLYLEVMDASFSFDGVIGAFVLSNYLPVIALGLGVGALFVRSMTIHLVEVEALSEYRYLEHGAFYAIVALAVLMYLSGLGITLPEWGTGLMSSGFIGLAFLHSLLANRRDAAQESASAAAVSAV